MNGFFGNLVNDLRNILSGAGQTISSYFNPQVSGTGGFWGTPIASALTTAQNIIESPRLKTGINIIPPPRNLLEAINPTKLIPYLAQETVNVIPRSIYAAGQIAKSQTPQQLIGNVAQAAELPLTIASFGTAGPILSAGKAGLSQALLRGARVTAPYGFVFGGLRGLSEGTNAPTVGSQLQTGLSQALLGGLTAGTLGAGFGGAGYGIRKLLPVAAEVAPKITVPTQPLVSRDELLSRFEITAKGALGKLTDKPLAPQERENLINQFSKLNFAQTADKPLTRQAATLARLIQADRAGVLRNAPPIGFGTKDITKGIVGAESEVAPKIVEQKFRTDKLNLTQGQTAQIETMRDTLGLTTRKVRTFADMEAMAKEIGVDPNNLLKEIQTGRITDKEVIGLRNLINNDAQMVSKLEKQLKLDPANGRLQAEIDAAHARIGIALKKLIPGGTEAGRTVAAFRIIANKSLDPAFWFKKAQEQLGDKPLTQEYTTIVNDLIGKKDRLGLARFIASLGESNAAEKAVYLWKAGLLTSPTTHLANIFSTATMGGLENIKDIPGTALDIAISKFTGKRTTTLPTIAPQIKGALKVISGKGSFSDIENLAKADVYHKVLFGKSKGGQIAQKYVDSIFGALGKEDAVFKEAAFNKSLAQQAIVEGLNNKLTKEEVQNLVINPTEKMVEQAKADALYATFNKPNVIASGIARFRAGTNPLVAAGTQVVAPFTRTPLNVAEALIDYSPVGPIKTVAVRLAKGEPITQKVIVDAISRATTGVGIIWIGAQLAAKGLVTGSSPSSASERAQWELEGKKPNSILIGGEWRSLNRLSPLGNLLSLGAEYQKSEGSLATTAAGAGKGLTEQTFLKGVSGALGAINEPERKAEQFISQTIASTVPSFIGTIARAFDPYQRQVKGIVPSFEARIPGLRQNLPQRYDALGRPLENTQGILGTILDPFTSSKSKLDDPVVKLLHDAGYDLSKVGTKIGDTKLDVEQQNRYQVISGAFIYNVLNKIVGSAEFQALSKDDQQAFLKKAADRAKDMGRTIFKAQEGIATESDLKPHKVGRGVGAGRVYKGGRTRGRGIRVLQVKAPKKLTLKIKGLVKAKPVVANRRVIIKVGGIRPSKFRPFSFA